MVDAVQIITGSGVNELSANATNAECISVIVVLCIATRTTADGVLTTYVNLALRSINETLMKIYYL